MGAPERSEERTAPVLYGKVEFVCEACGKANGESLDLIREQQVRFVCVDCGTPNYFTVFLRLCDALGADPEDLLGAEPDPPEQITMFFVLEDD